MSGSPLSSIAMPDRTIGSSSTSTTRITGRSWPGQRSPGGLSRSAGRPGPAADSLTGAVWVRGCPVCERRLGNADTGSLAATRNPPVSVGPATKSPPAIAIRSRSPARPLPVDIDGWRAGRGDRHRRPPRATVSLSSPQSIGHRARAPAPRCLVMLVSAFLDQPEGREVGAGVEPSRLAVHLERRPQRRIRGPS